MLNVFMNVFMFFICLFLLFLYFTSIFIITVIIIGNILQFCYFCYTTIKNILIKEKSKSTAHFSDTPPFRQDFSLPDSIVYYIAKNSSKISLKACHKLSKTCKYFYSKNGVIFVVGLSYDFGKRKHWGFHIWTAQWSNYFTPKIRNKLEKTLEKIQNSDVLDTTQMPWRWPPFLLPDSFDKNAKIRYVHQMSFSKNLIIFCAVIPDSDNLRFTN